MINVIEKLIANKRVLILGFGKEGQSTFEIIKKLAITKEVYIADKREMEVPAFADGVITGDKYLDCLDDFDVVFKSPGIVLPKAIDDYSCHITCQMDLFLKAYKDRCIGITGSKGKSTTSSFLCHLLRLKGYHVLLGGNIGIPVFDLIKDIDEDSIIVLEISCHQLEYAHNSPHIAVLLNIFEEHLDHYGSFEKYAAAKKNIFLNQNENDILYINKDNDQEDYHGHKHLINKNVLPFSSLDDIEGCSLNGDHFLFDLAADYEIGKLYGVEDDVFYEALRTFKPLPHRLEYFGTYQGIRFYDDSISTINESAINAIASIKDIGSILIGGLDRGIDYSKLVEYLKEGHVKNICLMYASGKKIADLLGVTELNVAVVENLDEAIDWAFENTAAGHACVLSPAAASYGYFKNFEERGDYFKERVRNHG